MLKKKAQTHFGGNCSFSSWTKLGENIKSQNSRNNLAKTSHRQKRVANSVEGQLLITRHGQIPTDNVN